MSEELRKEYLAFCESQFIHPRDIYFQFWQASRAALVVELPDLQRIYSRDAYGAMSCIDFYPAEETVEAIAKAGVTVK